LQRRLLYVACTRAQSLLYLSHVSKRKVGGETKTKDISEFISAATKEHSVSVFARSYPSPLTLLQNIFTPRVSQFSPIERAVVAQVLGRADAPEAEVARRVAELCVIINRLLLSTDNNIYCSAVKQRATSRSTLRMQARLGCRGIPRWRWAVSPHRVCSPFWFSPDELLRKRASGYDSDDVRCLQRDDRGPVGCTEISVLWLSVVFNATAECAVLAWSRSSPGAVKAEHRYGCSGCWASETSDCSSSYRRNFRCFCRHRRCETAIGHGARDDGVPE
jgi:hypothetical protein